MDDHGGSVTLKGLVEGGREPGSGVPWAVSTCWI